MRGLWIVALLLSGCTGLDCEGLYGERENLGFVGVESLNEASGLAWGQATPAVFWTHNDGSDPNIYGLTRAGGFYRQIELTGVDPIDLEDIAVGPGPQDVSSVFVADIGDKTGVRLDVLIYRFPEDVGGLEVQPDVIELTYPTGRFHDAEALLLDPRSHDLLVVTKAEDQPAVVYRAPEGAIASDGEQIPLEEVAILSFGDGYLAGSDDVTGGDILPDGSGLVLRTEDSAYHWSLHAGETQESDLRQRPCPLDLAVEPQGEAIAAGLEGYATLSEGNNQPIYLFPWGK